MKKLAGFSAGMCLVFTGLVTGLGFAAAQEMPPGPPKVLVIQREMLKPGRAGNTHLKTESAFVQAMTAAKWPTHYFAAESQSGVSRALFFIGYPSFAAWEKDNADQANNATLTAAFDRASLADGEQLTEFSTGAYVYRDEMSLRAGDQFIVPAQGRTSTFEVVRTVGILLGIPITVYTLSKILKQ